MRRRLALLPALVATATIAPVAHATTSIHWPAPLPTPTRLYFHSANGGYLSDWRADPQATSGNRAPSGSALTTVAPTRTTEATALSVSTERSAGQPNFATFTFPFSGPLRTVCLDVWAQAHPGNVGALYVYVAYVAPGLPMATSPVPSSQPNELTGYSGALVRFTKLAKFGPSVVVPKGSALIIGADSYAQDPDWTMHYDSTGRFSSVTLNSDDCTPEPALPFARVSYAGPSRLARGHTAVLPVRLTDAAGRPLARRTFTLTVQSATFIRTITATTGSDGIARPRFTADAPPGAYDVAIAVPTTTATAHTTVHTGLQIS